MIITASMVAELRAKTDAPMMECKKALTEAAGDMAKAEEILRVKLGSKAGKAASRVTAEGVVMSASNGQATSLVELNCETDFVAKNEDFLAFGQQIAQLVAQSAIDSVEQLSTQILPCGQTVEQARAALIGKIGENVAVRRFIRIANNQQATYLHNSRIGVLVEFTGDVDAAKDAAMQVAAMKPLALTKEEIDPALIEREKEIARQKAIEAGRAPDIIEKTVMGTANKFLKEVALLEQTFVKNDKQSIADMLNAKKTKLHAYTLYIVGEGIEKRTNDFAAEVAAQVAASQNA